MRLDGFSRGMLEQAVGLYLEEAYGDSPVPGPVRERLRWPSGETVAALAASEVFERTPPDASPQECQRIGLRLGNRRFPHMKLGLHRVPDTSDWVVTVDTHDTGLLDAAREGEQGLLEALVRENADIKARIERRWGEAGLPTFERYVREQLQKS